MIRHSRRAVLAAVGRVAAGVGVGEVASQSTDETAGTDDRRPAIRVVNAAPLARPIAVVVDGDVLIRRLRYKRVSRYHSLSPGRHRVRILAADGRDSTGNGDAADGTGPGAEATDGDAANELAGSAVGRVLFGGRLSVWESGHTAVVLPARGRSRYPVWLRRFPDRDVQVDVGQALVRLVHASPDAPAVDVTVAGTGRLLFDGLGYGEAQLATVAAGERTLQIRPATPFNVGPVVRSVTVELEERTRYAVFAVGYLTPFDDSTDAPVEIFYTTTSLPPRST
jgi:hypothetical protein